MPGFQDYLTDGVGVGESAVLVVVVTDVVV
jgi:hypothetical protein